MPAQTIYTEYELRDLATGASAWFESLAAAHAELRARPLARWQIVHDGNNVVGFSHPEYWRPRRKMSGRPKKQVA